MGCVRACGCRETVDNMMLLCCVQIGVVRLFMSNAGRVTGAVVEDLTSDFTLEGMCVREIALRRQSARAHCVP